MTSAFDAEARHALHASDGLVPLVRLFLGLVKSSFTIDLVLQSGGERSCKRSGSFEMRVGGGGCACRSGGFESFAERDKLWVLGLSERGEQVVELDFACVHVDHKFALGIGFSFLLEHDPLLLLPTRIGLPTLQIIILSLLARFESLDECIQLVDRAFVFRVIVVGVDRAHVLVLIVVFAVIIGGVRVIETHVEHLSSIIVGRIVIRIGLRVVLVFVEVDLKRFRL
ncbi:BZ3500_MvSof-1268-A1-R1_Chr2-1g04598 [Microbotryum saponariae]|uniref:BZ3500_MvSof-1268-A1-R1_Chr2-1g04598 protein n=1 Tax=Microbotryum saponariae TaxID=289078 RepID=A0A2X0KK68_9BASI|nr:BZ3500_MvSof-1268-A1-R1_Chr2-1g04598 [Microbotryum saponariae]SCZ92118.1 BZ3501_MvSof-1269-A2-R1_Chr2-1g04254 [Microbotryum saponariae]